jgi:hypothetical protein
MGAGDGVTIYGCLSGWSWCDIGWRGNRGWAAGQYLQVVYHNQRGPITSYGGYIGLPFITFSLDSYWNNNYRHRNFYGQMRRFEGHPPPMMPNQPGGQKPMPPKDQQHHDMKPPFGGNNPPKGPNTPGGNNPPKGPNHFQPQGPGGNGPNNGQSTNGQTSGPGSNGHGKPVFKGPKPGTNGPAKPEDCGPGKKFVDGSCQ